ncbi:hypothetical protein SAMN07250955_101501 [Arboricoccus pini]|uniref:Sel1 repeat-containing protein n=1 Tax=Arboricoccus pini TaxID=1963835 RepID=A0A212Q8T5_9PROT|nr:sel1 repeat family protein [Arboricoccus pini]SNB55805.1 hypothetical protein SAMN07250955_101501 [Arboricoccus pini]
MPTRVEQTAAMEAGYVRLTCLQPLDLDPATLEIGMARLDRGTPHFLDPLARSEPHWVAGERWFKPGNARLEGKSLTFEMGPALTWRLKPHTAYLLHLRDASGNRVEDRLAWLPLRLPSTPPDPQPADPPAETKPEPASSPTSEPDDLSSFADMAAVLPEPVAAPPPEPPPERRAPMPPVTTTGRSYVLPLLLALLVLLAAGGGAYWWFFMRGKGEVEQAATQPPPVAADSVPLTLDGARGYISQKKPNGEDAAREAKRFADAGQADAAFLLYRRAAQEGDVPSMLTIARMYDPQSFKPGQGPVAKADPDEASTWYEKAADKGNAEAMQRLGTLLKDPQITRPDAAERATYWAQKAADAAKAQAPGANGAAP